jgi:hypothetical protein
VKLRILGRFWGLSFVSRLKDHSRGECDPPCLPGKEIRVLSKLRGEERLEVLLHEMLHAAQWHLDEAYVEVIAADMARALWRLGYREGGERDA